MKKILIISLLISLFLVGCGGEAKESINVYNWGDYIDREVLELFEEEYGIEVKYDTFATNEDLYVKIKQGSNNYDVIFPSDYMIERMLREDLLRTIDKNNIINLEKIDEEFINLDFDLNNEYSVPYMWGTVGIIYNTTMVDEEVNSWDILWDEKYEGQILMLDSQRDTIAVALKKLGHSMNTRNIEELEEAKEELIKQKPLVYAYLGDNIKSAMVNEEGAIAVVWSGDAVVMIDENPNLNYVIPDEGSNLWFDSMVIPKTTTNKDNAEKFINFMTRPDISAKNAEYIGYSSPVGEAVRLLDERVRDNPVAYPSSEIIRNTEVFKDPYDIIETYDRIWTEITSHN